MRIIYREQAWTDTRPGLNSLLRIRFCQAMTMAMALAMVFCSSILASGKQPQSTDLQSDVLTKADKQEIVFKLKTTLSENYVFPDVAKSICSMLDEQIESGAYDQYEASDEFAKAITIDLRSINADQHLNLEYRPEEKESSVGSGHTDNVEPAKHSKSGKHGNYGFEQVRILPGNIGYLKMSSFSMDQYYVDAQSAAASSMNFLSNSEALIIDLRNNPGGSARLVRFLASYLFAEKPVHLNDYYFRTTGETEGYWTLREVPGQRMPETPVYVLVNKNTFSAAEAFSYNLKHLGRAVVVGEQTGGGAHGGRNFRLSDRFVTYVPFSRSINPVTGTDWEGVGVTPDMVCVPSKALLQAHAAILKAIIAKESDVQSRTVYSRQLTAVMAKLKPVVLSDMTLSSYVGVYELGPGQNLTISKQSSQLFAQMTGEDNSVAILPVTETRFRVDEYDIEFTFNVLESDEVSSITLHKGAGITASRVK